MLREQSKGPGAGHLPGLSEGRGRLRAGHLGQKRRAGIQGAGTAEHLELCRNSRAAWPGPVPARAAGLGHACGGRGSRLSAPGRCSPRGRPAPPGGCSPRPATPAGARLPRRQARDPAGRGAGLSLSIHRHPAAGRRRRRLENSGEPAPWGWGRRELRGGTPPSRPRCDRGGGAARGAPGALPGGGAGRGRGSPPASSGPPARAPSRAESGRGARHNLCRQHTVDAQPGQPSGKTRGATQPVPSEHLPALPGHQVHEQDRPSAVCIQRGQEKSARKWRHGSDVWGSDLQIWSLFSLHLQGCWRCPRSTLLLEPPCCSPSFSHTELLTVLNTLFIPLSLCICHSLGPKLPSVIIHLTNCYSASQNPFPCHLLCEVFCNPQAGAAPWDPAVRTACLPAPPACVHQSGQCSQQPLPCSIVCIVFCLKR